MFRIFSYTSDSKGASDSWSIGRIHQIPCPRSKHQKYAIDMSKIKILGIPKLLLPSRFRQQSQWPFSDRPFASFV